MGNCLVLQGDAIQIMKPDGKILEYQAPIKVQQVLSDFCDHAIADSHQAFQHLLPDTNLLCGHLYYLVPLQFPSPAKKKKVRFSIPQDQEVKDVQEKTREMLRMGGVSLDDMVSKLHGQQRVKQVDTPGGDGEHKGWKPVLETIPEIISH
ncbi:DUF4228 domain-containing protein [Salix suchowensis]|nr:DUF4228 domain-containing protein [Salix suchowensis]